MLGPADVAWLEALERAPELRCVRWRVARWCFAHLSRETATPVKLAVIEHALRISHVKATDALTWLVERGLLVDEGRDGRRTRSLRLGSL